MLAKDVLRCVQNLLKEDGFRSSADGILLRPIRPGFETFVGLNAAIHRVDGLVGINPVVGVRDDAVENLLTELTGNRGTTTLSISLGYLMPEQRYIEWKFGTADTDIAKSLLHSIRTFGFPAVESLASPEAIIESLKTRRMTIDQNRAYRLPVAYLLRGKKKLAIQELHCELDSVGDRADTAAKDYRRFAYRLENRAKAAEEIVGS